MKEEDGGKKKKNGGGGKEGTRAHSTLSLTHTRDRSYFSIMVARRLEA